jgi:hypothetical protein
MSDRLKIIRGDDQTFVLKIRTKDANDPLDLTTANSIAIEIIKSNRTSLILDLNPVPPVRANASINDIIITANTAGAVGNTIILQFDGTSDLATIVNNWNTQHPLNTIAHNGLGSEVIQEGSLRLQGGYNSYTPLQIFGNPVLGKIKITLTEAHTKAIRLGLNQSFSVTIDYGTHPTGNRIISQLKNKLDVVNPLD